MENPLPLKNVKKNTDKNQVIFGESCEFGGNCHASVEIGIIGPLSEWKRIFFQNGADVFVKSKNNKKVQRKLQRLESDLKDRNEVIAELLQENIKLKKSSGGR